MSIVTDDAGNGQMGHIEVWANRLVKREVDPVTLWSRCYFSVGGERINRFWWTDADVDRDADAAAVSQEYSAPVPTKLADDRVADFGEVSIMFKIFYVSTDLLSDNSSRKLPMVAIFTSRALHTA